MRTVADRQPRRWLRATTSQSAPPRSHSSRSRAPTARAASCRRSAGTSQASSTAASPRRSGRSSSSTRAEDRTGIRARLRAASCIRGKPRKRARAGSASCIRRSSRARGAPSSSISTRSSRQRRRPSSSRRSARTPRCARISRSSSTRRCRLRTLLAALREAAGPLLRSAAVFDEYRGEQIGGGQAIARIPRRVRLPRADAHRRRGRRAAGSDRRALADALWCRHCGRDQTDPEQGS